MNRGLDDIGKNSVLSFDDAEWLKILADDLYNIGHYTKAIYLDTLVENARRNR